MGLGEGENMTNKFLEPYHPTKPSEHWCAKCDCDIINSNDKATGSFFVVNGHCFSPESKHYDGDYKGIMFALCVKCLSPT